MSKAGSKIEYSINLGARKDTLKLGIALRGKKAWGLPENFKILWVLQRKHTRLIEWKSLMCFQKCQDLSGEEEKLRVGN